MTDKELILKEEVHRIVGWAMEVLNVLGHGLLEKPYENALVVEFNLQGIPCQQQRKFNVIYKEVKVAEYVPDLICFDEVVVDTKTIDSITNHEIGKMLNPFLLHHPLTAEEEQPTFAFPFSPADLDRGAIYAFRLNHVLELTDPMEAFSLEVLEHG